MPELVSTLVVLDRERTLRFDYDSLELITGLPLARRGNRSPLQLWADANGFDVEAMAIMLWAAARHEERDLTLDHMKKALRQTLRLQRMSYKAINEKLNAALNQSEVLGLMQETDDDADADASRPTTPPTAPTPTALRPTGTTGDTA